MFYPIPGSDGQLTYPNQIVAELELISCLYDPKAQYATMPLWKKKNGFINIIFKNVCHSTGKEQSFEQVLGKMYITCKRIKFDFYLITYIKINSEWVKT